MSNLTNNLNIQDQPSLSDIAPLVNGIVNVFIVLNFVIALAIYSQAPNPGLIIIRSYFMTYVWVAVYALLGLILLYGKISNQWNVIKFGLVIGLFVKAIFTYALIVLGLHVGFKGIIGVTGLWLAMTAIQFHTVRNFKIPGSKHVK